MMAVTVTVAADEEVYREREKKLLLYPREYDLHQIDVKL
jgi:RNA-binding protein YlmH